MVVKSLEIQDSLASDCGGGVVVVPQHLMVSPGKEKSPKVKITVKYGGKRNESFDSPMPSESKGLPMSAESKESTMPLRRSSARIQAKQKEVEELRVRRKAEILENAEKSSEDVTTTPNKRSKKSHGEESVAKKEVVSKQNKKKSVASAERETKEVVKDVERAKEVVMDVERTVESENVVGALADNGAAAKVKDTIRIFNKHYLHFVQVSFFSVRNYLVFFYYCVFFVIFGLL